jgi:hypothetical protein
MHNMGLSAKNAILSVGLVLAGASVAGAQDYQGQQQQYQYPEQQQQQQQYQYPQQQYPQQQYPQQQQQYQYPEQQQQPQQYQYPQQQYGDQQPQYQYQYQDPNQPQYQPPPDIPHYGYASVHPIPYDYGGSGFCYQSGAHFHEYAPFDQNLFREANGYFYFVGDPSDFGYARDTWRYRGHHPIPLSYGGGYCYIDWPHRHFYAPPAGIGYNLVGDYYVYGGSWDPWYWRHRDRYVSYYGGYYRSSYYGNRYYVGRPQAVYRPTWSVGAPGVYRGGAVVVAPGGSRVTVGAPRYYGGYGGGAYRGPAVGVGVGVGVGVRGGGAVVAPAPRVVAPAPRVVVPPPRVVAPAPRVVVPGPRVVAPPAVRR